MVRFGYPTKVKVAVTYRDGTQADMIMNAGANYARLLLNPGKTIGEVVIQPTQASIVELMEIAVNQTVTPDPTPEPEVPVFYNGKADLSRLAVQDASKTTYNTESHKMATTDGWTGVVLTTVSGEHVSGAELMVTFAEPTKVKVAVYYSDGSQTDMIMSEEGTLAQLLLDNTKAIREIQIQPTEAGVVAFSEIAVNQTVTPEEPETPVFTEGYADLSRLKSQDATKVMYDATTAKMAAIQGWIGVALSPAKGEEVSGAELMVTFAEPAKVKLAVTYSDDAQTDTIMSEAGMFAKLLLDNTKTIREIQIQPTEAGIVSFDEIVVNQTVTPDPEPELVFDEDGNADLTKVKSQDVTKVLYNPTEHKMAALEGWIGVSLTPTTNEEISGAELLVTFVERIRVKLAVNYSDSTACDSIMETEGKFAKLLLDPTKQIMEILIQPTQAGVVHLAGIKVNQEVTPDPMPEPVHVFFNENREADLSMLEPMSEEAVYDAESHVMITTSKWAGVQKWLEEPELVDGNMISLRIAEENADVRITVRYADGSENSAGAENSNAVATGTEILVSHDSSKEIQNLMIQSVNPATVTILSVKGIDFSVEPLKEEEVRLLWKNSEGAALNWNDICKKDEAYGAILEEDMLLCINIASRDEDNEWPKVFIRDASSNEVGEVVELNKIRRYPHEVQMALTAEMVEQMRDGFSICGDGITINRVSLYKPNAPQEGDINLMSLNGGYNSYYNSTTHTVTTTSRWGARGWDVGDGRYNGYDLIRVEYEEAGFPVTLKMEYVDADGMAQAVSSGAGTGHTAVELQIPEGTSMINSVYLQYQEPGQLTLTSAKVMTAESAVSIIDLGKFEEQGDKVSYDKQNYTMSSDEAYGSIQLWLGDANAIENGELLVLEVGSDANVSMTVGYTDGTEVSADAENRRVAIALDHLRNIQKILIQHKDAGEVTFLSLKLTELILTHIDGIESGNGVFSNGEVWYSTGGVPSKNPGKGVYIHKGKKIIRK